MSALTTTPAESLPVTSAEPGTYANDPLTSCGNLVCGNSLPSKGQYGPAKRFCSQQCRNEVYALRRAKALLDRVGVVKFYSLLDQI
jgi:hypothetical protein